MPSKTSSRGLLQLQERNQVPEIREINSSSLNWLPIYPLQDCTFLTSMMLNSSSRTTPIWSSVNGRPKAIDSTTILRAYTQLRAKLSGSSDRGIVAVALEKVFDLDSRIQPAALAISPTDFAK